MHRLDRYLWTARIILISSGSNISIAGTIKAKTGSNWIKPELTGSETANTAYDTDYTANR